jgi:hypothetical protein
VRVAVADRQRAGDHLDPHKPGDETVGVDHHQRAVSVAHDERQSVA